MIYQDFPTDVWDRIHRAIENVVDQKLPRIAAFDADGTLWDNDAGNAFFNYEIENKLIPLPAEPWKHVYAMKAIKATAAFLWLAQIHKGLPIETVKAWAQASYEQQKFSYFPAIEKLFRVLNEHRFEVFVVTASVKWAVEPCVRDLGVDADHVLGFQTRIDNGIITDIQEGPNTYREGKAEALLQKTKGLKPVLSCGNTMGDFWLLDMATHIPLAVRSIGSGIQFQDKDINAQELKLFEAAQEKNWIAHNFMKEREI